MATELEIFQKERDRSGTTWTRNEEFDKTHNEGPRELDNNKRDAMYQRAQDIMEESGAYKFITHEATPVIYSNSIVPALRPDGLPLYRYFAKA